MTVKPFLEKTFTEQFATLTIKDQPRSLPTELWLHAASFLNKSDLKNLALASKAHLCIAQKALNDLEKITALCEFTNSSTFDPKQPASCVSCASIYKKILNKASKDGFLILMNPELEAILLQKLSELSFHEAANRLKKLHQTLAFQINSGKVFIDSIEISYELAKKVLLEDAIIKCVSGARNPEKARSVALDIAIRSHSFELAKSLIASGSITLDSRNSAVRYAARNGHLKIVRFLLASGNITLDARSDAFMDAVRNGNSEIVRVLLANGMISEDARCEAFYYAATNGYLEIVQALLAYEEISLNTRDMTVRSAAKHGHLAIVKAVLASGEISKCFRDIAIKEALKEGHLEIVQALSKPC